MGKSLSSCSCKSLALSVTPRSHPSAGTLRPAPPLPVYMYTSTEYSLPGATQLSQMRSYEIFSLWQHENHVITFTNLAPPNRSEPSQSDWPRTVLRPFEAFITAVISHGSIHFTPPHPEHERSSD